MGGRLLIWFIVLLFCLKGTPIITLLPGVGVVMFSACLAARGMSVVVKSALAFAQHREHSLLSVLDKG